MNERKQKLREARLSVRRNRAVPASMSWTPVLREALSALAPGARTVALYWPIRGEPDPGDFARALASEGVTVALPVCGPARTMDFRRWDPSTGKPTERDAAGIPAPVSGEAAAPDALIVPCVGWSAGGRRIGYGGGYYDRWIEGRGGVLIGIGFMEDRIDDAEDLFEAFDLRLQGIATDAGFVRF